MISPFPSVSTPPAPSQWSAAKIEDLTTAQRHRIQSAGFQFAQFDIALRDLHNRWRKGRLGTATAETLHHLFGSVSVASAPTAPPMSIEFAGNGDALMVIACDQPGIIDPRHWALLHLPGLRSWWTQALRSAHFKSLQVLIPKAWTLENAELPPGSVIADLNIPDWSQLSQCIAAGRRFVLWQNEGESTREVQTITAPQSGAVLIESPSHVLRFKGDYVQTNGRIELKNLQVHR